MRAADIFHPLIDFCYPNRCSSCNESLARADFLCSDCQAQLRNLEFAGSCKCCGMPLRHDDGPCPYCMNKGRTPYEKVLRLGIFVDPLKPLIHHMKYHGRWILAEQLADRLLEREDVKTLMTETQIVVPMPLYWRKQIWRGYNQCDVIARRIGKRCGVPVCRVARRIRNTRAQTGMHSQAERAQNVQNAFKLKQSMSIADKHVVVIDDVLTSGSTLRSLGRELADGKPASLSAIVLAVADPRGRGFERI